MAVKLKDFNFDAASKLTTSAKGEYPWETWFDGDIWLLTVGEDFHGHPLMMERVIRTSATNRKAKVHMRHVAMNGDPWGQIVLQRHDVPGPAEVKREGRKAKAAATRAAKAAPKPKKSKAAAKIDALINGAKRTPSKRPSKKLTSA